MRLEELHLIGQHALALQIDVFGMGRAERHGEQGHARLFRGVTRLVIVAALTRRDHIGPAVRAAAADAAVSAAEKILVQSARNNVADTLIAKGIDEVKKKLN